MLSHRPNKLNPQHAANPPRCAFQIFPDLLVIVIVILSRVSLVPPVIGVGLYQGDPHRNDAPQAVFSWQNFLPRTSSFGHEHIQGGGTFQSGSTGIVKG